MNKHTIWAWVFYHVVNLICWALLAVVFGRWWIALFAVLFLGTLRNGDRYFYCDICGACSPAASTLDKAEKKRVEAGWIRRKTENGMEDICPACQKRIFGAELGERKEG